MEKRKKVTIPYLLEMKEKGELISFLTAYDYPTALIEDRAGIEMILVGDSAAMCLFGHRTTLPVTMDEMISITKGVTRATEYAFVVGDMPYMSYQSSYEEAIRNAGRFMGEAGVDAIKLEGGTRMAGVVKAIVNAGIPVMGHIGLTPQSYTQLGGFKSQGRDANTAMKLIDDALALEAAGAFSILLEAIPNEVGEIISERLDILTLGIGAGQACDGQLLIVHDLIGLFETFTPKFVKKYANVAAIMEQAFRDYRQDVRTRAFPQPEHYYPIPKDELAKLRDRLNKREE
ncbi:3-methyl-2-oxobutanoate hydroxymethyltransferase [Candidatus Acetothermia bacterium]|nr:3-methyl-2-oxobutanoate hydroxymethyltransferase [Candidatus Acetothermia bacterium]